MRAGARRAQRTATGQNKGLHARRHCHRPEHKRFNPDIHVTSYRTCIVPLAEPFALLRLVAAVIGGVKAIIRCRHLSLHRHIVRHHPERRLEPSEDDRKCDKQNKGATDHRTIIHLKPALVMAPASSPCVAGSRPVNETWTGLRMARFAPLTIARPAGQKRPPRHRTARLPLRTRGR